MEVSSLHFRGCYVGFGTTIITIIIPRRSFFLGYDHPLFLSGSGCPPPFLPTISRPCQVTILTPCVFIIHCYDAKLQYGHSKNCCGVCHIKKNCFFFQNLTFLFVFSSKLAERSPLQIPPSALSDRGIEETIVHTHNKCHLIFLLPPPPSCYN